MICSNCIKNDVCSIYTLIQKIRTQGVKLDVFMCQHSFDTLYKNDNDIPEPSMLKDPKKVNELSRKIHEMTNDGKKGNFKSSQSFKFTVE